MSPAACSVLTPSSPSLEQPVPGSTSMCLFGSIQLRLGLGGHSPAPIHMLDGQSITNVQINETYLLKKESDPRRACCHATLDSIARNSNPARPLKLAGLFLLPSESSEVAIADQFLALLVPQPERERLEAREQRDRLHFLKQRVRLMASLQIVIRDLRAQMMNVMISDVPREPLQHLRQFVKRTPLQRRRRVIPVPAAFPIHPLELVLHIEQPHARAACHHQYHQLDQQIRLPAKHQAQRR